MKWIKNHWSKILLMILVAILVYGIINHKGLSQDYKVLKTKAQDDSEKSAEIIKEANARIEELLASRNKDNEIIQAAEIEIEKLKKEKEEIRLAYILEKAKIKELPDDKLALTMNNRIGDEQVKLLQIGIFSLKREGAERSVQLFLEGEECQQLRKKDIKEIEENQQKINAMINTNNGWELQDKEQIKIINALQTEVKSWKEANNQLESDFKKSRMKQFLKGTVAGAGLILVIRLLAGK